MYALGTVTNPDKDISVAKKKKKKVNCWASSNFYNFYNF